MKTSNKFLVYSFSSILLMTMLFAIALRIHSNGVFHFYIAQDGWSGIVNSFQNEDNNGAAFAGNQANFAFKDFERVEISGGWEVVIKRADQYQVKVFADKRVLDSDVAVEQQGEVLSLRTRGHWFGGASGRVRAEISLPTLKSIEASGGSKIVVAGFSGDALSIVLSGGSYLDSQHNNFARLHIDSSAASKITMRDDAFTNLDIALSGSSFLKGDGSKIGSLSLEANGASKVDLANSKVTNATIGLFGASKLEINMAGGNLKGEAKGASKVIYSGEVRTQEISTSGASSVVKK